MIYSGDQLLFSETELACRCCGKIKLAPGIDELLSQIRILFNEPMALTSACRCAKHNARVGGHYRSLHVFDKPYHPTGGCCAFDVKSRGVAYNARLIEKALALGWSAGVNKDFIHLDRRDIVDMEKGVFAY